MIGDGTQKVPQPPKGPLGFEIIILIRSINLLSQVLQIVFLLSSVLTLFIFNDTQKAIALLALACGIKYLIVIKRNY